MTDGEKLEQSDLEALISAFEKGEAASEHRGGRAHARVAKASAPAHRVVPNH